MTAQASEMGAVVVRLEKVEQQNQKLKMVGVVALALAVAGMIMGQAMPKARIVEAEGFVLKDAAGKPRAELAVLKNGLRLALYDENDKARVLLAVDKEEGPGLHLYDENGKDRADLGVGKAGPVLALYDENDKIRAELAVSKYGPGLVQYDENGKKIWGQP